MTAAALNEAPTLSPINHVLDLARVAFEAQMQGTLERVARIKAAADAYVRAAEMTIAADIARRIGVEPPSPSAHDAAAQALRALVLDLPELKATEPDVPPLERVTPTPAVVVPMRSTLDSYEASHEARALWNELKSLDFETMSVPLFKATAAELAARARVLQDRGENAELIPERVIKGLTARAAKRGITGIYGLAHSHKGDWPELARKARAERDRLQTGSNGLTHKLQIPEAVVQRFIENKPVVPPGDGEEPAPEHDVERLPKLQVASKILPVVLVGGLAENKRLDLLQERFGITPEWIETEGGVKGVMSLETRIRERNVSAVVVLDGLISHKHFDPIVAATRQTGIPLAYGATAGIGSLRKAFLEIEEKLQGGPKTC